MRGWRAAGGVEYDDDVDVRFVGLIGCAGLALGAGCTFPRPPDVGDDEDAAIDARIDVVAGTWRVGHRTAAGVTEVPVDLSTAVVQVLIRDEGEPTGFRIIDGTGRADGSFTVEGVPPGVEYYLKVGTGRIVKYWITTHRAPAIYVEYSSRADVQRVTEETPVTLEVDDVVPFSNAPGHAIDFLAATSYSAEITATLPAIEGDTHVLTKFDWRSVSVSGPASMPDTTQGDDFHLVQVRERPVPTAFGRRPQVTTIVAAASTEIAIRDGMPATARAALTHLTDDHELRIEMSRNDFDGRYDPTSSLGAFTTELFALPAVGDPSGFAAQPPMLRVRQGDWSRDASGSFAEEFAYAQPFPASWQRIVVQSYDRARWLMAPVAGMPAASHASITYASELALDVARFRPALTPPSDIRLGDAAASAGGAIRIIGTHPLALTWRGSPLASQYRVEVIRVSASAGFTRLRTVATFTTAATSIALPLEVLSGGDAFTFVVAAVIAPNDPGGGFLEPDGLPMTVAATPTGGFRIGSTCGDGIVDAGEACDERGPTTTCDVDCTAVICGDGLRNVAAGETCDTIMDTLGCDSDCSPPRCGDGHRNVDLEDCDDGNALDDGNGCSADCRFDNGCPDGHLEPIVEACDDGPGSAACDDDCTPVVCGDRTVNTAAGEQCDDGNQLFGDGCSSSCQLE